MNDLRTRDRRYADYLDDPDEPDEYVDYPDADYAAPADHRWRPVAVIAGGVFLAAAVATAVILNSDNNGSTATVVGPPPTRTVAASPPPTTSTTTPSASLSPETVTTLTPAVPPEQPAAPPSPTAAAQAAPPPPAVNPRTVVYTVTGAKQLFDLVSVVYTDAQGMPHTDVNVALPWTKTVVLNPGVGIGSVTATSLFAHLNCTIVNAGGQTVAASVNNSMIATCTR